MIDGATLSALVPTSALKVVPTALTPPESIFRDGRDVMVKGHVYVTREGAVQADEIYLVHEGKPSANGVWLGEADKVAWRDAATGYECLDGSASAVPVAFAGARFEVVPVFFLFVMI